MRSTATALAPVEMEDEHVLSMLATEATNLELDDVGTIIYLVKTGDKVGESVKRLKAKGKQKPMARTFAFLMNLKEDDDKVKKFTKDGLAEMIFFRLKQLMPKCCKICNKATINGREEMPLVSCKLCGIGACKDCFPSEERSGKWFFLCGCCDQQTSGMMGEEALDKSHFRVNKKQDKADGNKEKDDVDEELEDGDDEMEDEKEKEVVEILDENEDFKVAKKRGFLAKKKKDEIENKTKSAEAEKVAICHHFKKARCHHGISGKQAYNGTPKCPYRHPMICQRLLRHGDRAKGGCRGREDGCSDFHQVKMCYSSMNTKKCDQLKDCKNGYHVKGTVAQSQSMKNEKEEKLSKTNKEGGPQSSAEKPIVQNPGENNSNMSSFLGQLFLQQQEMMVEQQQQRKEQAQMQQQLMQLMTRLGGALEGRMTPTMGMQNPMETLQRSQTLGFRPVG